MQGDYETKNSLIQSSPNLQEIAGSRSPRESSKTLDTKTNSVCLKTLQEVERSQEETEQTIKVTLPPSIACRVTAVVNEKIATDTTVSHSHINCELQKKELHFQELVVAIEQKNTALIKKIFTEGVDINRIHENGFTPLQSAVLQKNQEAIELLLNAGADCSLKSNQGKTALDFAIETNEEAIAVLIINNATEINDSHLFQAVQEGQSKVVNALLDKGVDPSCVNSDEQTLLHIAASVGADDVLCSLVATGKIDVNAQDNRGITALHEACAFGGSDTAFILIEAGAENRFDDDGLVPIEYALEMGHSDLVADLKNEGFSVPAPIPMPEPLSFSPPPCFPVDPSALGG